MTGKKGFFEKEARLNLVLSLWPVLIIIGIIVFFAVKNMFQ